MEIEEVIELHRMSKTKINLQYQSSPNKIRYCYIDPSKPLTFTRNIKRPYGMSIYMLDAERLAHPKDKFYISVYKNPSGNLAYADPATLEFQNKNKAATCKILYGKPR